MGWRGRSGVPPRPRSGYGPRGVDHLERGRRVRGEGVDKSGHRRVRADVAEHDGLGPKQRCGYRPTVTPRYCAPSLTNVGGNHVLRRVLSSPVSTICTISGTGGVRDPTTGRPRRVQPGTTRMGLRSSHHRRSHWRDEYPGRRDVATATIR